MKGLLRAGAAAVGIGVAAVAGTGAFDDNTTRDESGAIVEAGGLGAFAMQVGDCFDDPEGAEELVTSVAAMPCTELHDNEVYAIYDTSFTTWPGQEAMYDESWRGCHSRFAAYVGAEWEYSTLDLAVMTPSDGSWQEGDREVVCFLYDGQLRKLTGSMQGSAR